MKHQRSRLLPALCCVATLLTLVGCAGRSVTHQLQTARASASETALAARMENAERLSRMGRHYDASFQLEAALDVGGDEVHVLPRLAAAQIRAGRLRAAKRTLARLARIAPTHPHAGAMLEMLEAMAPGLIRTKRREEET